LKRPLQLLACLPLLAGAGLFEHYALTRQRLQLGVDSAADGGANALADGRDIEEAARRRLAKLRVLRRGDLVVIERPPDDGRFRGWKRAVRVRVRQPWSPPLIPRGLADRLPLDVTATAVAVPPGPGHPKHVALRVE
jgi:hypothetical protein